MQFAEGISENQMMLLFDPQTSGGLLMAVEAERLPDLLRRAQEVGQPLWEIGEVTPGSGISVR